MNESRNKKKIYWLFSIGIILAIILIAALYTLLLLPVIMPIFIEEIKASKNPNELKFFIAAEAFFGVWLLMLAPFIAFYNLKFGFNLWIRILIKDIEVPIHRFPSEKGKLLTFIYKYIYIKPTYDLDVNLNVAKQGNKKAIACLINAFPVLNLIFVFTGLGLIINAFANPSYHGSFINYMFMIYIFAMLAFLGLYPLNRVVIYTIIKENNLTSDDFNSKYTKLMIKLFGTRFFSWILKTQLCTIASVNHEDNWEKIEFD
ncbi:hypothetical protein ACNQ2I_00575 [Mycoplasma sp. Z355B]|uniref:hypothetical protein n=1 Tax=Mycoplasma sp. Z355B TaxID=3401689 RepID=UPI003AB024D7